MRLGFIISLFTVAVCSQSCRQIPNDGIPFYMKMDSAVLVTNSGNEGANTHGITDVWVEANASTLGAFEMPINFPVLIENEVRFVFNPGIKESGQTNSRVIYPFYQPDTFTLNAKRGNFYSHTPVFRYKSGAVFSVLEDFESGNSFSGVNRLTNDSNILYGMACGKISVSAVDSNEIGKLIQSSKLNAGTEVWVEIDYKAEVPFYIGFYANYSGSVARVPVVFVNSKTYWNKLYANLTIPVGNTGADSYTLYVEALRPYGTNGGSVYIDNIKLIHF